MWKDAGGLQAIFSCCSKSMSLWDLLLIFAEQCSWGGQQDGPSLSWWLAGAPWGAGGAAGCWKGQLCDERSDTCLLSAGALLQPLGTFKNAVGGMCRVGGCVFWFFFCFVSSLLLFPQASINFLLSETVLMTLGPSLLLLRPGASPCCSHC